MDRASIIAIEEVCKRCHLYTKHCGMLEYPSQCVASGHFIDGYRKAEKDLALTWEDAKLIYHIADELETEGCIKKDRLVGCVFWSEVVKRFIVTKKKED